MPDAEGEKPLEFDLQLVPLDDLIKELRKRHSAMLFCGRDVQNKMQCYWGGYATDAVGLAAYAKARILFLMTQGQPDRNGDEPREPVED